jgi:hypothetical protein
MKFLARKTFKLGPLRATVNQSGRWSFAIHFWRYTYNITRRTSTFNTPGPGYVRHHHGRNRNR